VTFQNNDVTGNLRTPLALTFTRNIAATDRKRLDPKLSATSFQYVQNSFFSVSDPMGPSSADGSITRSRIPSTAGPSTITCS